MEAIRLLKQLQQENHIATTEEQIALARFVGWGGLANALTPGKEGWEKEYDEISELLTEEEMQSASASTLTSYYTDQKVIEFIYQALYQFGFRSGNILDPALGTGNFFSALPESMNQSRLYGVELEPIAGALQGNYIRRQTFLSKGMRTQSFPKASLMWWWAMYLFIILKSVTGGMTVITSRYTIIFWRKVWIR